LIVGLASAVSAQRDAEDPEREAYTRSHYTKFEHRIPMRDGVKLIDEYPGRLPGWEKDFEEPDLGGTQQMVRSEALRGRYRTSYIHPEPFTPGEITQVEVELQDVLHTFKRGHRVYRSADHSSSIVVGILV